MPELPEVETVVRTLSPDVIGRTLTAVHTDYPKQITTHSLTDFRARLINQRILSLHRRAKYIVFTLDSGYSLLVHLRMTGHLSVVDPFLERHRFVHVWFELDNGRQLHFRDMRKFGTIALVEDASMALSHLGPEPLEEAFTLSIFEDRLARRKTKMKPLLLNQQFVAGIGNIYADEALFMAGISPLRTADTLTPIEIEKLYQAIKHVLRLGIERGGASINDYVKPDGQKGKMQEEINVFRRTGFPCYRCQAAIVRIKLAQRSTHFCPVCQQ